jgi:hypothetical protein
MRHNEATPRKRWTPDEIKYLKKYYGKRSVEELSRAMGRSVKKINVAAHVLGLRKGGRSLPLDRS